MKHRGYKGASDELHLTKAAISQAVTTLESQIGKKLFLRVGQRMQATPEAEKFYNDLQVHQLHLQRALESLLGHQSLSGELRIGAYFEFAKSKMIPVVEKFLLDHPAASLRFRFESPSRLDQLLVEQKIDLSISIYPHRQSKSIRSHRLLQQELVLVAKKGLWPKDPLKIKDFQKVSVIDYFTDHVLIKRWCRHHLGTSLSPQVRVFAASAEMALEMIRRGLGLGVVPRYVAEPLIQSGELTVISPKKDPLFDFIWLNEGKELSSRVLQREFVQRLKADFRV